MEQAASQHGADDHAEVGADDSAQHTPAMALPGRLDLSFANALLAGILARTGDQVLTLDGTEVDYASTPCVQILLSAGRKRDAANQSMIIRDASDAFRRAIDEFGLRPEFTKWMV